MSYDDLIKTVDDKTEWIPATLRCQCGVEWTNDRSRVQKGKDPYVDMECRACSIEREKREAEERAKRISIKRMNEFDNSLPPRYRGKLKDPIYPELLDSTCSIICGGFGTGKTWESYTVTRKLFELGAIKNNKLITEVGLLNDLKESFDFMGSKIDYYKSVDFLVIDEAGKNNDSDFNKAQLFEILNHRYDWELKTILICNVSKKEDLYNLLPTAVLDRFRECIVLMEGKSRR